MRYALISDIHANEAALRAVLADSADLRVEKIICLGDVLGYGPDPVAALELVYRKVHVCLAGNHDDAIANRCSTEDFTPFAVKAVERQRKLLSAEAVDWLRHLPYECAFEGTAGTADGAFACVHGDFSDAKQFNYVIEPEEAMPSWEARPEQLLFTGHTHKPGIFVLGASGEPHRLEPCDFMLEDGKRYLVNVGSVGYPRSGVCRSCYCIYDDVERSVAFRFLPFDLESYREKMQGQGLDEAPWVAARARERRRPEVRGAAKFGVPVPPTKKTKSATSRKSVPVASKPVVVARPERKSLLPPLLFAAAVVVAGLVWCTRQMTDALNDHAEAEALVKMKAAVPVVAEPEEEDVAVSDAAPTSVGEVVQRARCTVPAGGRIRFAVKLKRGSVPAWVHLRFENGKGEPAGDGLWYQNVKASKRSPKAGLVAPEGATAAFVEVVRPHAGDACEVAEITIEPAKEMKK